MTVHKDKLWKPLMDLICVMKEKRKKIILVFTCGKQEVEDLDDDCRADDADNHHPHDEEEERQRLGAEALQPVPELLHPLTHHLHRATRQSHPPDLIQTFNLPFTNTLLSLRAFSDFFSFNLSISRSPAHCLS